MKQPLHIIYTPGLGDRYDPARRACLKLWRLYGARVTMVPMRWRSDETYADKRARVETLLGSESDEKVVLMGESAGGSVALALYAQYADSVAGAMTLCGKNTRSDNVASYLYTRNPAFRDSMRRAESVVDGLSQKQRQKFVSVVPWYDPTVPVQQTLIPGCQKMSLPAVGHLLSILAMLTIYAPLIVYRAKKM
jgi:pimeloyl-ACP methyl ester carboxylesterase